MSSIPLTEIRVIHSVFDGTSQQNWLKVKDIHNKRAPKSLTFKPEWGVVLIQWKDGRQGMTPIYNVRDGELGMTVALEDTTPAEPTGVAVMPDDMGERDEDESLNEQASKEESFTPPEGRDDVLALPYRELQILAHSLGLKASRLPKAELQNSILGHLGLND